MTTNKQKSQAQREKDFKELVLNMLTTDERNIISQINAGDLYYLVFSVYHPYSGVKEMIESIYENLDILYVYSIIMDIRNVKNDLKIQISYYIK